MSILQQLKEGGYLQRSWRLSSHAYRECNPITDASALKKGIDGSKDKEKLKEACQGFETVFMGFMLKAMRQTVQKNDLFGSSKEEECFTDMMDNEICKGAAKRCPMGIADMLYRQLSNDTKEKTNETRGETR